MYKRYREIWLLYIQHFGQRYYYMHLIPSFPSNFIVSISIRTNVCSFGIETQVQLFNICPSNNILSGLEDTSGWTILLNGLDTVVDDPTILLDCYQLPSDRGLALVNDIVQGTTCLVSNASFNRDSSLIPTGTSTVVLAPSTNCETKFYAKGNKWVTVLKADQSAYLSEPARIIAAFTFLDVLVYHHRFICGSFNIALDSESALNLSCGDSPLSVD